MSSNTNNNTPVLSFGLIADVQYADIEDGFDFHKTNRRYYRGALDKLKHAISFWNNEINPPPAFLLQLGDVLDGRNKRFGCPVTALKSITDAFDKYPGSIYHVWGNHEYYNFTRETLLDSKLYSGNNEFCSPVRGKGYYSAEPLEKLKIIVLDCYDISVIANPEGSENYEKGRMFLEKNPNEDKNASEGLTDESRRFVKYNGGISSEQLHWLDQELDAAKINKQNVIIIGHCPIHEHPSCMGNLCFNSEEILEVFHRHSEAVVCYLSGHVHQRSDVVDKKGIPHIVLPAILENDKDSDFGTVYLYNDIMRIVGNGRVEDFTISLQYDLESSQTCSKIFEKSEKNDIA